MLTDKLPIKKEYSDWVVICSGIKAAIANYQHKDEHDILLALSVMKPFVDKLDRAFINWRPEIRVTLSQSELLAYHTLHKKGAIRATIESIELFTTIDRKMPSPLFRPMTSKNLLS